MCGCTMSGGGFGIFGWLIGTAVMLGFWGLLIWGGVALYRTWTNGGLSGGRAEAVLARRYAAGEISEDEYRERFTALQETRGAARFEARR